MQAESGRQKTKGVHLEWLQTRQSGEVRVEILYILFRLIEEMGNR